MKYLLLILPFLSFGQYDKELHYGCGLLISIATGEVVYRLTDNNAMSLSTGILLGAGAGYGKEKYDQDISGKTFDLGDFGATCKGAVDGAIVLRVRIDIGEKKQKRKLDGDVY